MRLRLPEEGFQVGRPEGQALDLLQMGCGSWHSFDGFGAYWFSKRAIVIARTINSAGDGHQRQSGSDGAAAEASSVVAGSRA